MNARDEALVDRLQAETIAARCGDLVGPLASRSTVPVEQWQHVIGSLRLNGFVIDPQHLAVGAEEIAKHARSTAVDAVSQDPVEQWRDIVARLDLAGFKVVRKG